ncbi:YfgM family protein [Salinisphaera aquimarina]|uniref:Ancillary SecYEG translocon subunit n=1 Tax=Salinisphaera aquimarina TaxID=2094031 RepID=A0ABV7EWS4_9GAMM
MADFDENEELTQFKHWWAANGMSIMIGAVVGVVVIVGWQGWRWYHDTRAVSAAGIYQQVEHAVADGNVNDTVIKVVGQLKDDYSGTPYAADAALRLAGYYVDEKQYDKAHEQLVWAMDNASTEGVRNIARVRAARLAWTQDDADGALKLLATDHPESFDALYAELAGDIHAAQGDREAAYKSYQLALESLPPDTPRQPLETKLADNAPAAEADAPADPKSASAS